MCGRRPGEEYQENCALPTVKHGGGSIVVWGCMTTAGTRSCGSLRETWIHNNHPNHTAKMTTALLLKVMEWPSMSPDLNRIEHRWGILKQKVEKHPVSNIQQLHDFMWKSGRGRQKQPVHLW